MSAIIPVNNLPEKSFEEQVKQKKFTCPFCDGAVRIESWERQYGITGSYVKVELHCYSCSLEMNFKKFLGAT